MLKKLKEFFGLKPDVALATENDHLIVQTDNSGEQGFPLENQDPKHFPEGSVR